MSLSAETEYEELVKEQEARTLFNKPVRYTTIMCHRDKLTYQEFIDWLHDLGVQDNLQSGSHFVEWWVELFLSYHEIEHHNPGEEVYKTQRVDEAVENIMNWREGGKWANLK